LHTQAVAGTSALFQLLYFFGLMFRELKEIMYNFKTAVPCSYNKISCQKGYSSLPERHVNLCSIHQWSQT